MKTMSETQLVRFGYSFDDEEPNSNVKQKEIQFALDNLCVEFL
jgi:hypothetical protein